MAGGVLALSTGIDVVNPVSLDIRRGPWASLAAAKAGVPLALRLGGLEVDILGLGTYQWTSADLSDNGLIPKSSVVGTTIWTVSGTNTYTATITGITAYAVGQEIRLKFTNANTGASTLNINSIGTIPLQINGVALTSGQIAANTNCIASYDGTNFQLIGSGGGGAGGDMVLAGTQTNTGLKTFLDGTLGMRNVANTFTSTFTNTNTDARTYTLPDFSGNVLVTGGSNVLSSTTSLIGTFPVFMNNMSSEGVRTSLVLYPTYTSTTQTNTVRLIPQVTLSSTNFRNSHIEFGGQVASTLPSTKYRLIDMNTFYNDGGFATTFLGINYNPTVNFTGASNHYAAVFGSGFVGIGTLTPSTNLHVQGSIRMVDGNQAIGKALISNENGVGAWTTLPPISTGTLSSGVVVSGASNSLDLGIGGSPLSSFTVNSSVSSNIQGPSVNLTGGALNLTGGTSGVDIEVTGGGGMILKTQSTGDISLGTNNINRVTISGTNGKTIFGTGDNASLVVGTHTADHTSPANGLIFYNSTLNQFRFRENGAWVGLGGGGGDMVLANTQTNTGAKTFNDNTLLLRNVADTFSSRFTNTNTAAQVYTLPNATGTVSLINLAETFSAVKTFSAAPAFNVLPTGTAVANIATASTLVARDSSNRILAASLVDGFTTTATASGTTTLVASSNKLQRFTGTLNQTVVLPTTTVVAGQQFYIVNASTGTITVNASGGTLVQNLAPNTTTNVTALIATPTLNTNWQSIYQPFLGVLALTTTGTSGAATLVGNTLNIPNYAGGGMVYPASGIPNSTGSAWGTSYSTTGSGTVVALQTSPSITTSLLTDSTSFNLLNTTATTINLGGATTTFNLGGTPTTTLTANLFANATASGQTKTINIGTSGVSGSINNINIGSSVSGALGTINISQPANIKGFIDGSTAASGIVGEVLTLSGSYTLTGSATDQPINSISLPPGSWMLYFTFTFQGSTTMNALNPNNTIVGISTSPTSSSYNTVAYLQVPSLTAVSGSLVLSVNISTTTTYYLKVLSNYTGANPVINPYLLHAVRIR